MFLIILEYAILAATFTLAKKALSYSDPFFLIMVRLLSAGALLVGYSLVKEWYKNRHHVKPGMTLYEDAEVNNKCHLGPRSGIQGLAYSVWQDRWLFLSAGLFHAYLAFIPEFWALQYVTSAKTSIIYAATPFVAALLSYLLHGERLYSRQWVGMSIGAMGLAPLIVLQAEPDALASFARISLPEIVLIGAMVSACYAWFVVKKLMHKGYGVTVINGVAMGIGGLLCIPTVVYTTPNALAQITAWQPFLLWLGALIFLSHVISYNLYSYLISRYSITFMTLCGFLCPLFATLFGAVLLGEMITWHYIASLVGVTVGLFMFVRGGAARAGSLKS